jgi:hypothetical protein
MKERGIGGRGDKKNDNGYEKEKKLVVFFE